MGSRDPERVLTERLKALPVTAAWLFGSHAHGTPGPLSDVDVAVLPEADQDDRARLALQGAVAEAAEDAFRLRRADVVLIDAAPPRLAFEALKGRRLLDTDPSRRVLAEARIMSAYFDRRYYDARWARTTWARLKREADA